MMPPFARRHGGVDGVSTDPPAEAHAPGPWRRLVQTGLAAGALAAAGWALYVLAGPNFHTVIPGAVYRTAQPSGPRLERLVRTYGIRTVVNLRGCCDPLPWYLEQCAVTNRLGLSQEDIPFSANRLPSVHAVRQLVEVLERSEFPILFHCHKGADRSGLASAIALLLASDTPLPAARAQVGLRFGHISLGRTGWIDAFFDLYADWLAGRGWEHTPARFRRWAVQEYCPDCCRCAFEVPPPVLSPLRVLPGLSFAFGVRCRNTSVRPWRMRPDRNAGVHAAFTLLDFRGRIVSDGRAGLFEATVAPGDSIDLTLAVHAPLTPGRYTLRVDMVDEQHAYFMQTGSEPLSWDVEVRP
jgi:hypothetical protein